MSKLKSLLSLSRSRRTETAILFGFVILIAVIALSGWRSAAKVTQFIEASDRDHYYALVVEGLASAIGNITEAESEQRGYLITGDASMLATYDAALVRVREGFDQLLKLTARDLQMHPYVIDVKEITDKRLEYLSDGINLDRTGDEARAHEYVGMERSLSVATRARFAQVRTEYQQVLDHTRSQVRALRTDAFRSFVATSALAAIVLAFMAVMVILEARFIRALSEELLHESRHDSLTGLPNRAYLNEWLARSISATRRAAEKLALLYIDLNGFKQVNDALGHAAGDEVLIEIARKLEATARDADFVARLGGDEFAVIMPRLSDRAQVTAAAERFSALSVTRGSLIVGASVGWAVHPDDADSAQALMQVSDAAMYERKQNTKRQ